MHTRQLAMCLYYHDEKEQKYSREEKEKKKNKKNRESGQQTVVPGRTEKGQEEVQKW